MKKKQKKAIAELLDMVVSLKNRNCELDENKEDQKYTRISIKFIVY